MGRALRARDVRYAHIIWWRLQILPISDFQKLASLHSNHNLKKIERKNEEFLKKNDLLIALCLRHGLEECLVTQQWTTPRPRNNPDISPNPTSHFQLHTSNPFMPLDMDVVEIPKSPKKGTLDMDVVEIPKSPKNGTLDMDVVEIPKSPEKGTRNLSPKPVPEKSLQGMASPNRIGRPNERSTQKTHNFHQDSFHGALPHNLAQKHSKGQFPDAQAKKPTTLGPAVWPKEQVIAHKQTTGDPSRKDLCHTNRDKSIIDRASSDTHSIAQNGCPPRQQNSSNTSGHLSHASILKSKANHNFNHVPGNPTSRFTSNERKEQSLRNTPSNRNGNISAQDHQSVFYHGRASYSIHLHLMSLIANAAIASMEILQNPALWCRPPTNLLLQSHLHVIEHHMKQLNFHRINHSETFLTQ